MPTLFACRPPRPRQRRQSGMLFFRSVWLKTVQICFILAVTRLLMEIISFCLGHDVHLRSARNMGIFQVHRQSCRDWRRRRRTCHQDMGLRSPTNFQ